MESGAICGLPGWIGIARNDTVAYINDILLAVVNGPSAMFAFLSNLAIIVVVVKNPSLQKPSNILLCSLASADCLAGITAQPMLVAWRFLFQRAQQSCSHQALVFNVLYITCVLTSGLSFTNVLIMSFDRHYALSKPLLYRANATKEDAVKTAIFANIFWLLFGITTTFILPPVGRYASIIFCVLLFVGVPTVNHVRMLFAIRRHNRQINNAVDANQLSTVLRREKKVAIDMCVVGLILLVSLLPNLSVEFLRVHYPRINAITLPWCFTVALMTSSINPAFYLMRNPNFRNAVKSMMNI
ncbi:hypothetical protein ACROYT_G021235 [Oculina patagonica]